MHSHSWKRWIPVGLVAVAAASAGAAEKPATTHQAWTLDAALAEWRINPNDPYMQYVVLQTARKQAPNRFANIADEIERAVRPQGRFGRARDVDLFSIFAGSLAVQESLQLDTMRGRPATRNAPPVDDGVEVGKTAKEIDEKRERDRRQPVEVSSLVGPTIKSHPWEKMLAGKKPDVGALAAFVPQDMYFIEFRSLTKMTEALEVSDLWGTHLHHQAFREANSRLIGERIKGQLAVQTNRALAPLYDLVVQDVAVAGSDLYVGEGSDVTLIFRIRNERLFKGRMDGFLDDAAKLPDAKRTAGTYRGTAFTHITAPGRAVHVFAAYPKPDLHIRSNSEVAFQRILDAMNGTDAAGKAVATMAQATEFAYIRSLMPRGAAEEDGFVYLSDPFIRKIVGPSVKLTERRRLVCYNHLRMIGHASMMYRTNTGEFPKTLAELEAAGCTPGAFNKGHLACPEGGTYTLAADGTFGVCSHHGHAQNLVPCCEIPTAKVTQEEAEEYNGFLREYNSYWRTFFDPIGIRIKLTPEKYRVETIVLPLIDNSIYTGMAMSLGGKPEPLDALPVPDRNIFTVAVRWNREQLMHAVVENGEQLSNGFLREIGVRTQRDLKVGEFISRGIGNQVGLHIYDAVQTFDINSPALLGELTTGWGRGGRMNSEALFAGFIISSLNSPVYVSIPVNDAKVVDAFLERLDGALAETARHRPERNWFTIKNDFYAFRLKDGTVARGVGISFENIITWRIFWARIGDGLYFSSKPFILEDIVEANAKPKGPKNAGPPAHAMLKMRAENWKQVLPDFNVGWTENHRKACLDNVCTLSGVARAFTATEPATAADWAKMSATIGQMVNVRADAVHGVHFFCPEGGRYVLARDGKSVACEVHGRAQDPRQPLTPAADGPVGKMLAQLKNVTMSLTFLEDGLHAVVEIDRK